VAHGAIVNSGDFYILESGLDLLSKYNFDIILINRWEEFSDQCDILVIMGGPIVTSKLHAQSNHIKRYLDNNKIPVIALGVGIGGKMTNGTFSFDEESKYFWKEVYDSSGLISVRDVLTYQAFSEIGIPTSLTGCPALVKTNKPISIQDKKRVVVSIPQITNLKRLLQTLFFLTLLKINNVEKLTFEVLFQHGYTSYGNRIIKKIANLFEFVTVDGHGVNLEKIPNIIMSKWHIGTRLHTHINFISNSKMSFLFNIDLRTDAFIRTIPSKSFNYNTYGIKSMVKYFFNTIGDEKYCEDTIKRNANNINLLREEMNRFLEQFSINYDF